VDTRPFFSRLSQLPAFNDRAQAKRFCSPDAAGTVASTYGINLPSGYNMTERLVDITCRALRDVLVR